MIIYETTNFVLETAKLPEIDRLEGGHIKITPKTSVKDRTELAPVQATELAWLTGIAGEAFVVGMAQRGVNIGRINYQDNGNWRPELHIHLYGRATNATIQKYGDPLRPGHLPEFLPLNEDDVAEILKQIQRLEQTEKFKRENWRLK